MKDSIGIYNVSAPTKQDVSQESEQYGSSFFFSMNSILSIWSFCNSTRFFIFNSRCSEAVIITGGHLLEDSKLAKLLLICVKNNWIHVKEFWYN